MVLTMIHRNIIGQIGFLFILFLLFCMMILFCKRHFHKINLKSPITSLSVRIKTIFDSIKQSIRIVASILLIIIICVFLHKYYIDYRNEHRYDGYKRYQTFDEFQMKGVGEPTDTPFVYVKTIDSTKILVYRSDFPKQRLEFNKINNHWESTIKWKWKTITDSVGENQYPREIDNQDKEADTYYKFLFSDTIVEFIHSTCSGCGETMSQRLYIKTKKQITLVELDNGNYINNDYFNVVRVARNYDTLRNIANERRFYFGKPGYLTFNTTVTEDSLFYIHEGKYEKLILSCHLNGLGLFGVPEFDKLNYAKIVKETLESKNQQ